jgi:hypothetical protein
MESLESASNVLVFSIILLFVGDEHRELEECSAKGTLHYISTLTILQDRKADNYIGRLPPQYPRDSRINDAEGIGTGQST